MRSFMKICSIALLSTVALTSFNACSKDDDPADNDLFIGTYRGNISYVSGSENKSATDGKVTVTKVGNNYNFAFSDGIPNINGVTFEKGADYVVSVGSDATKYIKVTASKLTIGYAADGKAWTADCSR